MDISDIYTNPIVVGLLAGLITYMYMRWKNDKDNEKNKNVNLLIPFAVFIVFWFITYAYVSSCEEDIKPTMTHISIAKPSETNLNDKINIKIQPVNNAKLSSDTGSINSFKLVSKSNGVHIPDRLPDVFFEMEGQ